MVLAGRYRAPWAGLVVLFAAWQATAALWGNDAAHPTLSLLLNPVLATYPGRMVGWTAWLCLGRWLVTRSRLQPCSLPDISACSAWR